MNSTSSIVLRVAAKAAIVDDKGRVLIVREAPTDKDNTKIGKWGLVGGRLNPGESFFEGLQREVKEETGLEVRVIKPLYVGEWSPDIYGTKHQIIAIFMLCEAKTKNVKLSIEHDDCEWVKPEERNKYPMMEPDCFVVDLVR